MIKQVFGLISIFIIYILGQFLDCIAARKISVALWPYMRFVQDSVHDWSAIPDPCTSVALW